jgi:hypothetical protein
MCVQETDSIVETCSPNIRIEGYLGKNYMLPNLFYNISRGSLLQRRQLQLGTWPAIIIPAEHIFLPWEIITEIFITVELGVYSLVRIEPGPRGDQDQLRPGGGQPGPCHLHR